MWTEWTQIGRAVSVIARSTVLRDIRLVFSSWCHEGDRERDRDRERVKGDGRRATEVLVNPATGAVWLEYGPAMMWNTRYGMMTRTGGAGSMMGGAGMMGGSSDPTWAPSDARTRVSAARAQRLAERRLAAERTGLTAGKPEAFPGYYTLHTLRGGRVAGMLSVNAATGAIWEHWWHGPFVTMTG